MAEKEKIPTCKAREIENLNIWGVLPIKYFAEAIEVSPEDVDKAGILAVQIQEKADEMTKWIYRILDAEPPETAA